MFVELFKRFGPNFRPEDVYAATLFGRMAALDAGVTTLLDWAHIQNSPEHADAAIRALREVGGRTVYAHGQPGIEPERWMKESTLPHPADIRRLRDHVLTSDDALVTLAMAARGPEFTTIELPSTTYGSRASLACGSPSTSASAPTARNTGAWSGCISIVCWGPTSPSCTAATAATTNST